MTGKKPDPLSTLDELTEKIDEEERQHKNYAQQIAIRMEQIQQRRDQLAKLRQEVEPLISEREQYANTIKDLQDKEDELQSSLTSLEKELADRKQRYNGIAQQIKNTKTAMDDDVRRAEEERQAELEEINKKYDRMIADIKKTADTETAKLQSDREKIEGPTREMIHEFKSKKGDHDRLAEQRKKKEQELIEANNAIGEYLNRIEEHKDYLKTNTLEKFLAQTKPKDLALEPAPSDEDVTKLYDGEDQEAPEELQLEEPEHTRSGTGLEDLGALNFTLDEPEQSGKAQAEEEKEDDYELNPEEAAEAPAQTPEDAQEDPEELEELEFDLEDADLDSIVDIPFEDEHEDSPDPGSEPSANGKLAEEAAQKALGPEGEADRPGFGTYSVNNKDKGEVEADIIYLDDGTKQEKGRSVLGKVDVKKIPDPGKALSEDASELERAVQKAEGWNYRTERGFGMAYAEYRPGKDDNAEPARIECFDTKIIDLMLESAEKMLEEAKNFPEVADEDNVTLTEENIDYLSRKSEEFKTAYVALTGATEAIIKAYNPQLNNAISAYMEGDSEDTDELDIENGKHCILHPEMARKLEQSVLKNLLSEHQVKNLFKPNLVDVSTGPQYLSEIDLNSLAGSLKETMKYLEANLTQDEWNKEMEGAEKVLAEKDLEPYKG